jgi:hypothetical protein
MRMNDSEFDKFLNYKAQHQAIPDFPFPEPEWTKVSARLDANRRNQIRLRWVLPASLLFMTLAGTNAFFWQKLTTTQQEIAALQQKILTTQAVAQTLNTTEQQRIHQIFDTTYIKKTVYVYDTIRNAANEPMNSKVMAQIMASNQQMAQQNAMLRKEIINIGKAMVAEQQQANTRIDAALAIANAAQKTLEAKPAATNIANTADNNTQFIATTPPPPINLNEWKNLEQSATRLAAVPMSLLEERKKDILIDDDMMGHFQILKPTFTAPIKPMNANLSFAFSDVAIGAQIGGYSSFNGLGQFPITGTTYGAQGVFGLNDDFKVVVQADYEKATVRGTQLPSDKKHQPKVPLSNDYKFKAIESENQQTWRGNIGLRYILPFLKQHNPFYIGIDYSRAVILTHDLKFAFINTKDKKEEYLRQTIEQQEIDNIQVNIGTNIKLADKWLLGLNAYNRIPLKKLVATPTKESGFNAGIFYSLN